MLGVLLSGATAGAAASALLIAPRSGIVGEDSDFAVAAALISGGALLSGWYGARHLNELRGGAVTITPQRRGDDARMRYDVGLRFPF